MLISYLNLLIFVIFTRYPAEPQSGTVRLLRCNCMSSYFIFRNHSQNPLKLHNCFFSIDLLENTSRMQFTQTL